MSLKERNIESKSMRSQLSEAPDVWSHIAASAYVRPIRTAGLVVEQKPSADPPSSASSTSEAAPETAKPSSQRPSAE